MEGEMSSADANVETARRYLAALERRADAAEVAQFFAPDVVQEEFPNRLVPQGARRDLRGLMDAYARGRRAVSAESYEVRGVVASGDSVALEVLWTGTLAMPVGALPAGSALRAHFGVFLDFHDGRIVRQRNYDCFEPFAPGEPASA
jgi:ketosteroid isomerase-like protein